MLLYCMIRDIWKKQSGEIYPVYSCPLSLPHSGPTSEGWEGNNEILTLFVFWYTFLVLGES